MSILEEPVLFPSSEYENVSATVLCCKELLQKSGLAHEARKLEGIDSITSLPVARFAYGMLRSMNTVKGEARELVDVTKTLLEDLIRIELTPLRKAS